MASQMDMGAGLSSSAFPEQAPTDNSAASIQYQHYTQGVDARGGALGVGRRTVVDPSVLFTHPPISNSQFGNGGSAKATFTNTNPNPEEGGA